MIKEWERLEVVPTDPMLQELHGKGSSTKKKFPSPQLLTIGEKGRKQWIAQIDLFSFISVLMNYWREIPSSNEAISKKATILQDHIRRR